MLVPPSDTAGFATWGAVAAPLPRLYGGGSRVLFPESRVLCNSAA